MSNSHPEPPAEASPAVATAPAPTKKRLIPEFKGKFLVISIAAHAILFLVAGYLVVSTIVFKPKQEFKAGPKGPSAPAATHQIQMTKRQNTMSAPASKRIVTKGPGASISLPDLPTVGQNDDFAPSAMLGMGATGAMGQPGGGLGGGGEPINFFGLRAKAKNVVFIIDITGSMVSGKKDASTWKLLEDELGSALNKLPSNTNFNVVVFGPEAQSFKTSLVPASKTNLDAAMSFVRSWSPTRMLKAGERGTAATWNTPRARRHNGTVPSNAFRIAFKFRPDVIMFLSDGEPTRPDKPAVVLEQIKALQGQLTKKVAISVIAYFADNGQSFMRAVAEQNGGEYREISEKTQVERTN